VIVSLKDKSLCKLPEGGIVDPQYHNMNMREIYFKLREKCKPKDPDGGQKGPKGQQGNPSAGGDEQNNGGNVPQDMENYSFDDHDCKEGAAPATAEEAKALDTKIDRALREGALLAGRLGGKTPRAIRDLLEPKTRWQDELREFVSAATVGKDEYTWRKFNRRLVANDIYMPSTENETIGEIVVAIDTSGSIGQEQLDEFGAELQAICDSVDPEVVRILWWDTMVHGEQVFRGRYEGIRGMLKPLGGGGTRVGCVSSHIEKMKIHAECVVVFTDGFVETNPEWRIAAPTLWLVTQNKGWTPPAGRKVVFES
jgi:predicted metal-dependent peptidase